MKHRAYMKIKIEGKGWTEYITMYVDLNPYVTPDYIEIEMDHEKAKAFLDSLSQALSKIYASDHPESKDQPRESQNGI